MLAFILAFDAVFILSAPGLDEAVPQRLSP